MFSFFFLTIDVNTRWAANNFKGLDIKVQSIYILYKIYTCLRFHGDDKVQSLLLIYKNKYSFPIYNNNIIYYNSPRKSE